MSSQLHSHEHEQNPADLSQPDHATSEIHHDPSYQNNLGPGTDVIGEPVNPFHGPAHTAASDTARSETFPPTAASDTARSETLPPTAAASDTARSESHPPAYSSISDLHAPSVSPISETRAPADFPSSGTASYTNTPQSSAGNFPTAQPPQSFSKPTYQSDASQPPTAQATSSHPYVRTSSAPGGTGQTPMDSIMQVFNKWSKKAEDLTGNVWNHLRTGPNIADTAFGRITMGAKAMSGGGIENVYRQTFEVAPEEHLLKTYACYLSTSTGPVAGTLYISSHKLAFCSDRPLAIPASPPLATPGNETTTPHEGSNATPHNKTTTPHDGSNATTASSTSPSNNAASTQQQCYYKVMVPISQVESVNPSENTQKKPPEKYVQVKTEDGHEFWFMGFVNYDKGVKNLQESLLSKPTSPNANVATHAVN